MVWYKTFMDYTVIHILAFLYCIRPIQNVRNTHTCSYSHIVAYPKTQIHKSRDYVMKFVFFSSVNSDFCDLVTVRTGNILIYTGFRLLLGMQCNTHNSGVSHSLFSDLPDG